MMTETVKPKEGLVSVIIPVYNSKESLCDCIDSVIRQTYINIEIVLIDDGSTDGSGAICDRYALDDNRIKVAHTINHGPAAARNSGIEKANGKYMFFIDADDLMEQDALFKLIEKHEQYGADMVIGDFLKIVNGNKLESGHAGVFPGSKLLSKPDVVEYVRKYLKKPNRYPLFVYSWGRLFLSRIIRSNAILFNADLRTFEDVAFNFKYLQYANDIFYLNEVVCEHLVHTNYLSASMVIGENPEKMFGFRQALNNISEYLKTCGFDVNIGKEVGHAYICYTIIQLIRICRQINRNNWKMICELIKQIANDPVTRNNLRFYSTSKGDSRIIPVLIKLKLILPLILVCRYKANLRYGVKGTAR